VNHTNQLGRALLGIALALGVAAMANAEDAKRGAYVLDHKVQSIENEEIDLNQYKGDVVMIVNVASKCGLTPQYEQLQALHEKYKDKGLRIVGFPANNFMGQEPGTNAEILTFCSTTYGVEFDMMAKISVKGDDQAPLYTELTSAEANEGFDGDIQWNFEKFLVGRDGRVAARFDPRTKPNDEKVIAAIEGELAQEAPADAGADS